ncbi:MAG: hypothetical protein MRJ92_00195 [Nitrospira sp.]|nr:hypothetical protein [Nitrospira sp.]
MQGSGDGLGGGGGEDAGWRGQAASDAHWGRRITETDILLAAAKAIVIGFNIRPEPKAAALSSVKCGVDVRLYSIIYDALNDIRAAMEGLPSRRSRSACLAG